MNDYARTRRRRELLPLSLLAVLLFVALGIGAASAITWQTETVDSSVPSGYYSSIALDGAGHPCIAYRDAYNRDLRYATWTGSAWQISTVDSAGDVGQYPSLALDSAGTPHISYYDVTNPLDSKMKYATRTESGWTTATVDPAAVAFTVSSIALDADGQPRIAYADRWATTLKYASFDGSTWHTESVPGVGPGIYPSLALDADGRPHIACYNSWTAFKSLMYVSWTGTAWGTPETVATTSASIRDTSLALDGAGTPSISYYDSAAVPGLRFAKRSGTSWAVTTVDTGDGVGEGSSLALDAMGNPRISYYDKVNGDADYAWHDGSAWHLETVDSAAVDGRTSLALDTADWPHVSYQGNGYLRYASAGVVNQPPVALFSVTPDSGGQAPFTVTFDASYSSDPDGGAVTCAWDFGDGTTGSGATVTHTYTAPGTYQVNLVVTDSAGATDDNFAQIDVAANTAPSAAFTVSPTGGKVPLAVTVDASGSSDTGGTIASYAWDWGDLTAAGSGATASHTYDTPGSYDITLTVTDNGGAEDTATATVVVEASNSPPSASFTATPTGGLAPLAVAFDASASSDPDGTVASYAWDFGDGSAGSGKTASHTYADPGSYTVTLTVKDAAGAEDTGTATIMVESPAEAIVDLRDNVVGLGLPARIALGLTDKLDLATAALAAGKEKEAVNNLNAFVKLVRAQKGKTLTPDEAAGLSAEAQRIIASIRL